MKIKNKIKSLLRVVVTTKNWPTLLFKNSGTAYFKSGLVLKFDNRDLFMDYVNIFREYPDAKVAGTVLKFPYKNSELKIDFGEWKPNMVGEIFLREVYSNYLTKEELKDSTVVDVGASFGETAIYFALNGAKKVYGVEPVSSMYKLMENNFKLNNLTDKCIPVFGALGGWTGSFLEDKNAKKIFWEKHWEDLKETPVFTLENFVEKNGISDGILKLDCEGYEKDIILNTTKQALRKFKRIVAEYHYGFTEIENKLKESGFSVSIEAGSPHLDVGRAKDFQNLETGFISALRID